MLEFLLGSEVLPFGGMPWLELLEGSRGDLGRWVWAEPICWDPGRDVATALERRKQGEGTWASKPEGGDVPRLPQIPRNLLCPQNAWCRWMFFHGDSLSDLMGIRQAAWEGQEPSTAIMGWAFWITRIEKLRAQVKFPQVPKVHGGPS